jgi:hypothetical protein
MIDLIRPYTSRNAVILVLCCFVEDVNTAMISDAIEFLLNYCGHCVCVRTKLA